MNGVDDHLHWEDRFSAVEEAKCNVACAFLDSSADRPQDSSQLVYPASLQVLDLFLKSIEHFLVCGVPLPVTLGVAENRIRNSNSKSLQPFLDWILIS